jgi:hypothetical protein
MEEEDMLRQPQMNWEQGSKKKKYGYQFSYVTIAK